MIRSSSPRWVYTTILKCPKAFAPIVTNRCSPTAEVSSIVNAIGSFRTPSPSVRETPCFRTFAASFFGSKVMLIGQYMHLVHISQMRSKLLETFEALRYAALLRCSFSLISFTQLQRAEVDWRGS